MNSHNTTIEVANEALNQIEVASEYLAWFESLSWAISTSIKNGHEHHALKLAGASQFLACDYRSTLEHDAKNLNDRLDSIKARA